MKNTFKPDDIHRIISKHGDGSGSIISILEDIQAAYNYLPKEALEIVAGSTGHSLVDIYGVATFYQAFSLEPRGEHLISVCVGTACHVRGAPSVLEEFERDLGVASGSTTEDKKFTLTTVNCLGACALGPVAVIDGEYCRDVKRAHVPEMLRSYRDGDEVRNTLDPEETLVMHALCPHCNRSLMTSDHNLDGHPMIHVTASCHDQHGWLRLSSVLGDHRVQSEFPIADDSLVNFFCPRCHAELRSPKICPSCDAPTIPLLNKKGGIITVCSRRGCEEHALDLF